MLELYSFSRFQKCSIFLSFSCIYGIASLCSDILRYQYYKVFAVLVVFSDIPCHSNGGHNNDISYDLARKITNIRNNVLTKYDSTLSNIDWSYYEQIRNVVNVAVFNKSTLK